MTFIISSFSFSTNLVYYEVESILVFSIGRMTKLNSNDILLVCIIVELENSSQNHRCSRAAVLINAVNFVRIEFYTRSGFNSIQ